MEHHTIQERTLLDGLASLLPLTVGLILTLIWQQATVESLSGEQLQKLYNLTYAMLFMAAASLGYFVLQIATAPHLTARQKLGWALFMLVMNGIAAPIWWNTRRKHGAA